MFLIECTIFWLRLKTAKSYSTGKDTNKAEDKPPDKSKEGSEYVYPCIDLSEYSASDPVHSNSMSYKLTRAVQHLPGLSATEDGHNIAKQLIEVENNEQFKETCYVKNVNRPDANKRNTNEEEGRPPQKFSFLVFCPGP